MRTSTASLVAATLVVQAASQKVVKYDIKGRTPAESLKLAKRDPVKEYMFNDINNGLYSVNVSIGTPGQNFQLQLDTGSTDIWVNSKSSAYCEKGNCADSFDTSKSSTYKLSVEGGFNVTYGDGSGAAGDYFTDVLSIGGSSVENQTFGLATQSDINYGLMGVGMVGTEGSCAVYDDPYCYPNVIDQMVSSGLINSHAFSLYLNDLNESTGSILFGGVDSARYTGELVAIPMVGIPLQNGSTEDDRYTVAWTDVTITTPNGVEQVLSESFQVPVLLDSGTTQAQLPSTIVDALYEQMGAIEVEGVGFAPCYLRTANATIDFHLGGSEGVVLKIALNDLLFDVDSTVANLWHDLGGAQYCQVGFYKGDDLPIFGDTILRSSYIVYDLANRQVAIAPADFTPGNKQDIQEITNATTSNIPGVSKTASAISSLSAVAGTEGAPVRNTATAAASDVSSISTVPTVPLASYTTAKYTGQDGYTAFSSITTTAPSGTGSGSSSSSSGAASSLVVPKATFEIPVLLGLVSVFMAFGAGMIVL